MKVLVANNLWVCPISTCRHGHWRIRSWSICDWRISDRAIGGPPPVG